MSLVVTIIANPVTYALDHSFANLLSSILGDGEIKWLCEATAIEVEAPQTETHASITRKMYGLIGDRPIDFAVQPAINRRKKALIADMDSTMIDQECIDELAAEIGVREKVSDITAKAMNGEIEFETALKERVELLQGLSVDVVDTVITKRITLSKGGPLLLETMKANNAHTALVSGGFTIFTRKIAHMLGFHEHHSNVLLQKDGKLTGKVQEPTLGADAKVENLLRIAKENNMHPEDFIAVGDGANDIPMLTTAGTGVALHAKPNVAAASDIEIRYGDLTALLYLQGYSQNEFVL